MVRDRPLSATEFQWVAASLLGIASGYDFGPFQDPRFLAPCWNMIFYNKAAASNFVREYTTCGDQNLPASGYLGLGNQPHNPIEFIQRLGTDGVAITQFGRQKADLFSYASHQLRQMGYTDLDNIDVVAHYLREQRAGAQQQQTAMQQQKDRLAIIMMLAQSMKSSASEMSLTDRQLLYQSLHQFVSPADDDLPDRPSADWERLAALLLKNYTQKGTPLRKMKLTADERKLVEQKITEFRRTRPSQVRRVPWEPLARMPLVEAGPSVEVNPAAVRAQFDQVAPPPAAAGRGLIAASAERRRQIAPHAEYLAGKYLSRLTTVVETLTELDSAEECRLLLILAPTPLERRRAQSASASDLVDQLILEASLIPNYSEILTAHALATEFVDEIVSIKEPVLKTAKVLREFHSDRAVVDFLQFLKKCICRLTGSDAAGFKLTKALVDQLEALPLTGAANALAYVGKLFARQSAETLERLASVAQELQECLAAEPALFQTVDQFIERFQDCRMFMAYVCADGRAPASHLRLFKFFDRARPQAESLLLLKTQIQANHARVLSYVDPEQFARVVDQISLSAH